MNIRYLISSILIISVSLTLFPPLGTSQEANPPIAGFTTAKISVKFADDLPISLEKGSASLPIGHPAFEALEPLFALGRYQRVISGVEEHVLDSLCTVAQLFWDQQVRERTTLAPRKVADMNNYFFLQPLASYNLEEILTKLQQSPFVDHAYRAPTPVAPPNIPPPGDFVPFQTYLDAGSGINAYHVYDEYNSRGEGFKIVDVEYDFNPFHNDLPPIGFVANTQTYNVFGNDHGTGVLGVLVSKNDGIGTTGIVSGAQALFAGAIDPNGNYNVANAITQSVMATSPGDFILLEQQVAGPNTDPGSQFGMLPVEYYQINYNAILMAVGNSRTVIEAAGNGSQNLGAPENIQGFEGHYPFLDINDSGAIMVGAGASAPNGSSTPRSRLSFSNYGDRLNLQGFGENVWTTGTGTSYDSEGVNYLYTASFNGTSSASPIVSGAAILLQSVYELTNGSILNPLELRELLMDNGQLQQNGNHPATEQIGPLPDLALAANTLSEEEVFIQSTSFLGQTVDSGNNYGYADFTGGPVHNWESGQSISLSLNVNGQGDFYPVYWRVWVDINQNQIFENDELLLDIGPINSSIYNGTISLPDDLQEGATRMRVSVNTQYAPGPCDVHNGEVEDYTVNLSELAQLSVSPSTVNFDMNGGTQQINVQSNLSWTASTSGQSWLSIQGSNTGTNDGSFIISCSANPNMSSRSTVVTVSGAGITQTIMVTQDGQTPSSDLSFSPASITLDWQSGASASGNLSTTGSQFWTATPTQAWLDVFPNQGIGNQTLTITANSDNTTGVPRFGAIVLQQGVNSFTINVTQLAEEIGDDTPPWGEPTPTTFSGTLIGQAQIEGIPASPGDWVGAFDEDGNLAGSKEVIINQGIAYINLIIYGDDATTPNIDEGINSGENFTLHLWDASENQVLDYPFTGSPTMLSGWVNTNGAPMPGYNLPSDIYNFELNAMDVIPLEPGWNLVSTDVIPADSSLTSIMSGLIPGNLEFVTGFDVTPSFYDPTIPFLSNLTHWTRGFGYWVKVAQKDTIFLPGNLIDVDYFKPMDEGWNLIAYLPQQELPTEVYLADFLNNNIVEYVTAGDNGYYDPDGPPFLNTLLSMQNSKGYWLKLLEGVNLDSQVDARMQKHHTATPIYEFVWGHTNAPVNSIIQVVDNEGKEWTELNVTDNGMILPTPLYGDEKTSDLIEGPNVDSKLFFQLNNQLAQESYTFAGDLLAHKIHIHFETLPDQGLILYPSPFEEILNIKYYSPEAGNIKIVIKDGLGREVWQYAAKEKESGWHQQSWEPSTKQNGIYFVTIYLNDAPLSTGKTIMQD